MKKYTLKAFAVSLLSLAACTKNAVKENSISELKSIVRPVGSVLSNSVVSFQEFEDGQVTRSECITLAPKLGFKSKADCINWFVKVQTLAGSVSSVDISNLTVASCQDIATGDFIMNVSKCAAFGIIPVAGEVIAGGCMIGALVKFNGDMSKCAGNN